MLIENHIYTTIVYRLEKNINVIAPNYNKQFGDKNCIIHAIALCRNLEINTNHYISYSHFKNYILKII